MLSFSLVDTSPRPLPRWLAQGLIAFIILLLLALSVSVPALFRPEPFAPWKSLGGPPGGAQHIIEVGAERPYGIQRIYSSDHDEAVWVRGKDGLVYTRRIACGSDANCASWRPVVSVPQLAPHPEGPLTRAADCDHLDIHGSVQPLPFPVVECVQASMVGADIGEAYVIAVMANGNVDATSLTSAFDIATGLSYRADNVALQVCGLVILLLLSFAFRRRLFPRAEH